MESLKYEGQQVLGAVEAILFTSVEPLSAEEISRMVGTGSGEILKVLQYLISRYKKSEAIEVVRIGERYLMKVKSEYQELTEKFVQRDLDQKTLQILALIAGEEPILQSKICKIMKKPCYDEIKELEGKKFIKAVKKGRSKELTTTSVFRDYFDLGIQKS